jgi:hypothetical protein
LRALAHKECVRCDGLPPNVLGGVEVDSTYGSQWMTAAKRLALLAAPPLVLGTTFVAFRLLVAHFGFKCGYLGGFLFYWVVWCLLPPWWVLGTDGILL